MNIFNIKYKVNINKVISIVITSFLVTSFTVDSAGGGRIQRYLHRNVLFNRRFALIADVEYNTRYLHLSCRLQLQLQCRVTGYANLIAAWEGRSACVRLQ